MKPLFKQNIEKELKKGKVILWIIDLKKGQKYIEYFKSNLSSDEVEKSDKFRFKKDCNCFIITRGVLRVLLSHYLNLNTNQIHFQYSYYGKPKLIPKYNLSFNVSHSGNFSVIGFFKGAEIGVDIEECKNDFDVLEIAQNFFSKKEIEALNQIPENQRERAFFRCWTRKEAFIKAEGSGLSFPLDKFTVSLKSDDEASLLNTYWDEKEKSKWSLHAFSPYPNYLAAVAVKGNVKNYNLYDWDELINKH